MTDLKQTIFISSAQLSAAVDVARWAVLVSEPLNDLPGLIRDVLRACLPPSTLLQFEE